MLGGLSLGYYLSAKCVSALHNRTERVSKAVIINPSVQRWLVGLFEQVRSKPLSKNLIDSSQIASNPLLIVTRRDAVATLLGPCAARFCASSKISEHICLRYSKTIPANVTAAATTATDSASF